MGKSKNKRQSHNSGNSQGSSNKATLGSNHQNNSRSRYKSASDSVWSNSEEHFPALGAVAAPAPKVNVWEQRKSKIEAVKALEPQNEYDEQAMLQQALTLSMLQAAEEERLRKEDEYLRQVGILENLHEDSEYFDASEELTATSTSVWETPVKIQSTNDFSKEKSSKNGIVQNCNQNAKTYNSNTKDFSKENSSRNGIIQNCNQNVKTYNSTGTKPKLNKIIDRFGGWGLKDERVTSSEKLSHFVDEVINEKPSKKVERYDKIAETRYQSNWKTNKENGKDEGLWHVPDKKEDKKPTAVSNREENVEVLYDGKGTFIDNDNDFSDIQNDNTGKPQKYKSSSKVLDTWLNSEEDDGWGIDAVSNERKEASVVIDVHNAKVDLSLNFVGNDLQKSSQFKVIPTPISDTDNYESENVSNKNGDNSDFSLKSSECGKSSWPDHKVHTSSENHASTCNFDASDHSVPKDFSQSTQIPPVQSKNVWEDNPLNTSPYFTLFPDKQIESKTEFDPEIKHMKFCEDVESEVVNNMGNRDDILPPILPPKPAPTVPKINEDKPFTNDTFKIDSEESPPILPPQPAPQPTFPGMNPFLYNPSAMLPGFNPLATCGMDPVAVRQILMLSNPFFASQLLAMEQYYRSLGIPVDLFSLSSTMPVTHVPLMMGPTMEKATFSSAVSSGPVDSPFQNQSENGSFVPISQNNNSSEQKSFENCSQLPGLATGSSRNISGTAHDDDTSSWYKSYLSSDSSEAIPPPKPPSFADTNANVLPTPEHFRSNPSASGFNQNIVPPNTYSSSVSNIDKDHKSPSSIEACMTKSEVTGWSDDEDKSLKTCKTKTPCGWDDDDGWGNDSVSAKSCNSHSVSENRRKTVNRQPSKQPQFIRYQGNKT